MHFTPSLLTSDRGEDELCMSCGQPGDHRCLPACLCARQRPAVKCPVSARSPPTAAGNSRVDPRRPRVDRDDDQSRLHSAVRNYNKF